MRTIDFQVSDEMIDGAMLYFDFLHGPKSRTSQTNHPEVREDFRKLLNEFKDKALQEGLSA